MIAMIGKFSKFHKSSIEIIYFYRVMIEKCRNMTNEQEEEEEEKDISIVIEIDNSFGVLLEFRRNRQIGKSGNGKCYFCCM